MRFPLLKYFCGQILVSFDDYTRALRQVAQNVLVPATTTSFAVIILG